MWAYAQPLAECRLKTRMRPGLRVFLIQCGLPVVWVIFVPCISPMAKRHQKDLSTIPPDAQVTQRA